MVNFGLLYWQTGIKSQFPLLICTVTNLINEVSMESRGLGSLEAMCLSVHSLSVHSFRVLGLLHVEQPPYTQCNIQHTKTAVVRAQDPSTPLLTPLLRSMPHPSAPHCMYLLGNEAGKMLWGSGLENKAGGTSGWLRRTSQWHIPGALEKYRRHGFKARAAKLFSPSLFAQDAPG